MKYRDWVELGAEELRRSGPAPFTVEKLCARAGRTKGSFYHHFEGIHSFSLAVVRRWIETETELVARAIMEGETPLDRLKALWKLTAATDHRLEMAVRALALGDVEIAAMVRETDERREAVLSGLLVQGYRLPQEEAKNMARLLHALHLSAQMRAPGNIADFSRGPVKFLLAAVEKGAASRSRDWPVGA